MIRGRVNASLEARVLLRVCGAGGAEWVVDALIDTGFTSSLTLPSSSVEAMQLEWQSHGGAVLADGSVRRFDVYVAEVEWGVGWRPVLVSAVGDEVLLGMRMLAGMALRVAVVEGGDVVASPL